MSFWTFILSSSFSVILLSGPLVLQEKFSFESCRVKNHIGSKTVTTFFKAFLFVEHSVNFEPLAINSPLTVS